MAIDTSAQPQAGADAGERRTRDVGEREARDVAEQARESRWERPSFARELYLGRFDFEQIHPYPRPEPETAARGEEFLARLQAVCEQIDGSRIERDARIPDEAVRALIDVGAFGMKISRDYGGLGLSMADYGRALVLAGSVHPSIGALLSAHQSIGVPEPVRMFGTQEQKQYYLPRCAAGAISAFLLTEPDVGSDPARLASTAVPTPDGDDYLIDGVKLWTTNGVIAELLVVMARVPEHDGGKGGITAFVVEGDSAGITVERRNAFMGLRGLENGLTRVHQVRVPAANRLGREGDGLRIALTTLNTGRISIPAMNAGVGKYALKISREWTAERVQWGRPVGRHEAITEKVSFMAATTFALEAVVDLVSQMADAGSHDIRIEAALAKLWASEVGYQIADELIQVRGGRGYESAESLRARGERAVPAEQLARDLRINRIFEGSTEIMRLFIAREAVDAHLAAAGDLASRDADLAAKARAAVGASGFYARWLPTLATGPGLDPRAYRDFGPLARHLRYVERSSRKLARQTFYGMGRWQAKLELRQGFLGRIVDIGAELFAMAATCSRAAMLREEHPDRADSAMTLAEAFCEQSRLRVEVLFDRLWHNTDDTDRRLARAVLEGDHAWLEDGVIDQSEGTGPWIAHWSPGPSDQPHLARRVR